MEKKIYGLLGGRLAHSYSPEIHAAFGDYEYRLFEMPEEEEDDWDEEEGETSKAEEKA